MFATLKKDPFGIVRPFAPRAWAPGLAWLEAQAWRKARQVESLTRDEGGQSTIAANTVITGIVVALAILVVGVILWNAIVGAAENTAADIEAAGNWSP